MITIRILPKLLASLAILFLSAAPLAVFADGIPFAPGWQIVPPCEDTPPPAPVGQPAPPQECGFSTFMHLIRHLLDIALFLTIPLATLLFTYAGLLYLSASASPGNISQAHGIFWSVGLGFMWVLGAWFVVKLISDALFKGVFKATGL